MTTRRSLLRKLTLDLTPLIDMITILLFGVMIYSVELSRREVVKAKEAAEQGSEDRRALLEARERARYLAELAEQREERLQELQKRLGLKEDELKAFRARLEQERRNVAEALAKLLGNLDADKLRQVLGQQDLSQSGAQRVLDALKEAEKDPAAAYKALRRIEEMEKAFTFIDLHLDAKEALHISINGRPQDKLLVHGKTAEEVAKLLQDRFQPADFNQIVLFMYSNEGNAPNYTVEMVDRGLRRLRQVYESLPATQGKQFRYAPLGIVDFLPPTFGREE
jgi:flagellar basal body-associated protein FliL